MHSKRTSCYTKRNHHEEPQPEIGTLGFTLLAIAFGLGPCLPFLVMAWYM